MISISRKITFCAGHRLLGHEGACRHLHGHNYTAIIHASADRLDNLGRVMDFSVLKHKFGKWIDQNWDHAFIVWDQDQEAQAALKMVKDQKIFLLPANPTAEQLARYLALEVAPIELRNSGVEISKIQLWETENCSATFESS